MSTIYIIIINYNIFLNVNVKFISKDQFIISTSAVVSSKIAQTKLIDLIAGARPNLII